MSIKAIGWAFEQGGLSPTNKLALIALADNANEEGVCWPGWESTRAKTGLSRASIYRAWKALEEAGLLAIEKDKKGREIKRLPLGQPVSQGESKSHSETGSNKGTVKEPSVTGPPSADVQKVYDHFVTVFQPKTTPKLGPSLIRQIDKGLKEYEADALCRAVDGLKQWRQRKPGKETLGAIFDTYPGGKPLTEQIAFFIGQAKGSTGVGNFPSGDRAIVAEKQRLVQRGHRLRQNEDAVKQAKDAEAWLRQHGIETVTRTGDLPVFRAITAADDEGAGGDA
jgi:DNA-binding transcriptional ArsR family regulator